MCATKEEIKQIVHEEIGKFREEVSISMDKRIAHLKSSPQTIEEMNKLKDSQEKLTRAIFGETDIYGKVVSVGMHRQVSDMYEILVQANGLRKILNLFLLFGGVSALLFAFFKRF